MDTFYGPSAAQLQGCCRTLLDLGMSLSLSNGVIPENSKTGLEECECLVIPWLHDQHSGSSWGPYTILQTLGARLAAS